MKFIYSAFIENTPEMREWLEELGYIPLKFFLNGKYIITKFCNRATAKSEWIEHYFESMNNTRDAYTSINCIGNPHLFQAVTAIREDSDYLQWFIHKNGEFILCWQNELKNVLDNDERYQDYCVYDCHKATFIELQNHFK